MVRLSILLIASDFVVPSLSLEMGSLFREAKRAKDAKTAKRFFFCSFC
jgi:hypothetical protein